MIRLYILLVGLFVFSVLSVYGAIIDESSAVCLGAKVICGGDFKPVCSDMSFTPSCESGIPSCCGEQFSIRFCDKTKFSCGFDPDIAPNTTLSVQILSGPEIPSIVSKNEANTDIVGVSGFAFVGSNPSFELGLKQTIKKLKIASIDIDDVSGMIFKKIPFEVIGISKDKNREVVIFSLPKDIKPGLAEFTLNIKGKNSLVGFLEIIDFVDFKNEENDELSDKPQITSASAQIRSNAIKLTISGKNFAEENALIKNAANQFVQSTLSAPNTTISVLPGSITANLQSVEVSGKGTKISARFITDKQIRKEKEIVIIVSTPRGSDSYKLVLRK